MDFTTSRQESDLATIKFSIEGNLSRLFDWNTKQVFMYLVCEYTSTNNVSSNSILYPVVRPSNAITCKILSSFSVSASNKLYASTL